MEKVTLRAGELEACVVPAAGMVISSLRHAGEEVLGQRYGLDEYLAHGRSFGVPLLYPWANRLGGFEYEAAGHSVAFSAGTPRVRLDPNGLPIHGVLNAYPGWTVRDADATRVVAELEFAGELLEVFPFPHALVLEITLGDALTVALTVRPDGPLPLTFGFHPWLTLPGVERADWQVELPACEHLELDAQGLPTGARNPHPAEAFTLADRTYDDSYAGLPRGAAFALSGGGRRITVQFDGGYPCGQVFAPPGQSLICFEPMTAPPNALVTGEGLREVSEPFTARFSIGIDAR